MATDSGPVVMRLGEISSSMELKNFVRQHPTQFGGLYFDQVDQSFHLNITSGTEQAITDQVRDMAGQEHREGSVATGLVVHEVKHSTAELESVKTELMSTEPWASRLRETRSSVSISSTLNKVRLGLRSISDDIEADIQKEFGDKVQLVAEDLFRTQPRFD